MYFRINLADLLSKLNQTEQAQKILDQLLKEEGNLKSQNQFYIFFHSPKYKFSTCTTSYQSL